MQNKFLVFQSKTHSYLRCSLILLTLFNFYLSSQLGYIWLYAVSIIFLIIVVFAMAFLYSYVIVSDDGLKLQYGARKCYNLRWEEILCSGSFSLKILGAMHDESYIYFSKKPISYRNLISSPILPTQSNEFIFLTKQNKALVLIKEYYPKFEE